MEKKEFFELLEGEMSKVKLTPFNWELADYENKLENDDLFIDGFIGFSVSDNDPMVRALNFHYKVPDDIKCKILLEFKPTFIVPMGEDSMAQSIGYPKMESTLWEAKKLRPGIPLKLETFNSDCIFAGQCEVCENDSVALIPISKYKIAQFLSLDYTTDIDYWHYREYCREYAQGVLGIELDSKD